MKRLVLAVLGAIGSIGLTAGSAAAWNDSYRSCPGAWWCPSAYYSPSFHRGPYYRPLPSAYPYAYGRYFYTGRRGACPRRAHRGRCR